MTVARCSGPVNRREFLQAGGLTLGGLTMSDVLAARASSGNVGKDTSVILLYLHGGASQLETYDLKPVAPSSYRSVFNPIATNVPGMDICEMFPRQAKIADKFSLIRSLHHDVGIHSDGGIVVLTGHRPEKLDPTSASKSKHPDFGSVASKVRGMGSAGIPPYVAIPQKLYMTRPAYLGMHHAPFQLNDPSSKKYAPPQMKMSAGRDGRNLDDRRTLLNQLDQYRNDLDLATNLKGTDDFRHLAFQMLTSPAASRAFDIGREDDKLRDRYGRHLWGQGCLLARRLAEAGTAVVSLYINTPKNGRDFTNWDDHPLNSGRTGHFGKYLRVRLPYLDQSLTSLIEDIHDRGLDKKIMVVAVGEFGRTPRLSVYTGKEGKGSIGRNHWPQAYTALVSGGGLKMGQAVGATNSKAEFPTERPYTPQDLLATIYRHLGIDYRQKFHDFAGRPNYVLETGEPIAELI